MMFTKPQTISCKHQGDASMPPNRQGLQCAPYCDSCPRLTIWVHSIPSVAPVWAPWNRTAFEGSQCREQVGHWLSMCPQHSACRCWVMQLKPLLPGVHAQHCPAQGTAVRGQLCHRNGLQEAGMWALRDRPGLFACLRPAMFVANC